MFFKEGIWVKKFPFSIFPRLLNSWLSVLISPTGGPLMFQSVGCVYIFDSYSYWWGNLLLWAKKTATNDDNGLKKCLLRRRLVKVDHSHMGYILAQVWMLCHITHFNNYVSDHTLTMYFPLLCSPRLNNSWIKYGFVMRNMHTPPMSFSKMKRALNSL